MKDQHILSLIENIIDERLKLLACKTCGILSLKHKTIIVSDAVSGRRKNYYCNDCAPPYDKVSIITNGQCSYYRRQPEWVQVDGEGNDLK